MGKTIAEKILSVKSGQDAKAGDLIVAKVDRIMSHDGNRPLPLKIFEEMGGSKPFHTEGYVLVIDHSAPSPTESISKVHQDMKHFARERGSILYDVGEGICHQLMVEKGFVAPGDLIIGSDSHTCTYGALGAFSTGMGSTDVGICLLSGEQWFKVPETMRVFLRGKLNEGIYAKDLILNLIGRVGSDGANYLAIEFTGEGLTSINMDGRFTIANMLIEMGAKAGFIEVDGITLEYLKGRVKVPISPVYPDRDADYFEVLEVDLSTLEPQVGIPHAVDKVRSIKEVEGQRIEVGFLGTCTNGRLSDLEVTVRILKGRKIDPNVQFLVAPASREVLLQAVRLGYIESLIESGAVLLPPGCGPCAGNHMGIPSDDQVVISTSNRNFKGRMGNPRASIYLASPATVAASVLSGRITDCRPFLRVKDDH